MTATTDATFRLNDATRTVKITFICTGPDGKQREEHLHAGLIATGPNTGRLIVKWDSELAELNTSVPYSAFAAICGQPIDQPEEKQ